ncbi:hypothetical protein [Mesorhizobium sp. CAU 1741]|uniref:hypothetical protein n=1 Tax=Mesorhizobium sp. CAU 1741 TaxID=3140366 RepID=UPI00325BBF61
MTLLSTSRLCALLLIGLAAIPASAQDDPPETIDFAGGELSITETPDYDKVLAFNGEELARDYFVMFDRIADVAGTDVAFFSVGPGGNACSPSIVMVWKPQDGNITSATTEDDCDTPAPAVTDYGVYFVPYLLPGEQADLRIWTPEQGFSVHGRLTYAPEPGTDWASFDPATVSHPLDLFRNADIYAAAQALLEDDLGEVAMGLGTAGSPEMANGLVSARGCVPHACGGSDSFVVIDPLGEAVYFAQQGDGTRFWPARDEWPAEADALIPSDF